MSVAAVAGAPASTYRLQLHAGFGFAAAADLAPYLDALGVSACYCSPYFTARPGSRHGYDVCDPGSLNPELGSGTDYDRFCTALSARGLGHIVDVVPNHMAADPRHNRWWRDVLENGPSSPFAEYFDIEWEPVKPELHGKVLLPVLGDQYGRVLERGELQLELRDGALRLRYYDHDLPINPRQSPRILRLGLEELERARPDDPNVREYLSILTALHNLPAYTERDQARILERQREKEVARERLVRLLETSPVIHDHVSACIARANGVRGVPRSFDALHELLEHQAYRLAYWRTAFDEINYRRFFDVNELVALRMERPEVFESTHALLRQLIDQGRVTGVRVDHPDGLFDPAVYFGRLRQLASRPVHVWAEKILAHGEGLPAEWAVSGTTGYPYLNAVAGLFVDPWHAKSLCQVYTRLTGSHAPFREVAYQSRRTIMLTSLASELNLLAHALNRIAQQNRRSRDFTLETCRTVLREFVACFPVYRTYLSGRGATETDRAAIAAALREARRRNPLMEASIFEFVRDVLLPGEVRPGTGELPPEVAPESAERLAFAMRLQQFTAPVQAKGVEDTAFYRYHVLLSANDVGGDPGTLAVSTAEFHDMNGQRLEQRPLEWLATSTHDTKRGEDARVRLAALSEMAGPWSKMVAAWMRINGRNRSTVDGVWAPDRNDEYLFYQALIGAWPAEPFGAPVPDETPGALVQRLVAYVQKAAREAKVHTSWINENPDYIEAIARFVENSLAGRTARRFLASFVPFQRRVAHLGMINALSQLVLKLGSPGIPDVYQGSELWQLALVDPDNRVDVDFTRRRQMLDELDPLLVRLSRGEPCPTEIRELLTDWHDARVKLLFTAIGLRFRRAHPDLLLRGAYTPLPVDGPFADRVVAFARHDPGGVLLVVVSRLAGGLITAERPLPLGTALWGETSVALPDQVRSDLYRNLLTGERCAPGPAGVGLKVGEILSVSPVAMLWAPSVGIAEHRDIQARGADGEAW